MNGLTYYLRKTEPDGKFPYSLLVELYEKGMSPLEIYFQTECDYKDIEQLIGDSDIELPNLRIVEYDENSPVLYEDYFYTGDEFQKALIEHFDVTSEIIHKSIKEYPLFFKTLYEYYHAYKTYKVVIEDVKLVENRKRIADAVIENIIETNKIQLRHIFDSNNYVTVAEVMDRLRKHINVNGVNSAENRIYINSNNKEIPVQSIYYAEKEEQPSLVLCAKETNEN